MSFNLHRSDKVPDWEKIAPELWNPSQKRAAETHGIDTPGNRETLKGAVATLLGTYAVYAEEYALGALLMVGGRYYDRRDGKKAEETGTKSRLGEAFDAIVDKIGTVAMCYADYKRGLVSKNRLIIIGVQQGANVLATGVAKARGIDIHSNLANKVSMWPLAGILTMPVAGKAVEELSHGRVSTKAFDRMTEGLYVSYLATGAVATAQLVTTAFSRKKPDTTPET